MLTVDDYGAIRRARRDGKSIRQIASEFEHSRNTIRKILKQAEPNPLPSTRDRFAPLLGPVEAVDRPGPHRRRVRPAQATAHRRPALPTAPRRARLPRRVCPGTTLRAQAPTTTSRNLHTAWASSRAAARGRFRPHLRRLPRRPRRLVPFLVTAWAYSNAPFVLALPFECVEAILEGMVAAFEFFVGAQASLVGQPGRPSLLRSETAENARFIPRMRWPRHYVFNSNSGCRLGVTRSPTPSRPSKPCSVDSPHRCLAWRISMS